MHIIILSLYFSWWFAFKMSGLFPSKLQIAFVPKSLLQKISSLRATWGKMDPFTPADGQKPVQVSSFHLLVTEDEINLQESNFKHLI